MVDSVCTNQGVPYADNFSVVNHYCITRVSQYESRLRVHSEVVFRKNVWGFVKCKPLSLCVMMTVKIFVIAALAIAFCSTDTIFYEIINRMCIILVFVCFTAFIEKNVVVGINDGFTFLRKYRY